MVMINFNFIIVVPDECILECGKSKLVSTTQLFSPQNDGKAMPVLTPDCATSLQRIVILHYYVYVHALKYVVNAE